MLVLPIPSAYVLSLDVYVLLSSELSGGTVNPSRQTEPISLASWHGSKPSALSILRDAQA